MIVRREGGVGGSPEGSMVGCEEGSRVGWREGWPVGRAVEGVAEGMDVVGRADGSPLGA